MSDGRSQSKRPQMGDAIRSDVIWMKPEEMTSRGGLSFVGNDELLRPV